MAQHTPQWRLDIKMLVETLQAADALLLQQQKDGTTFEEVAEVRRAIDLAIKLGQQYRK